MKQIEQLKAILDAAPEELKGDIQKVISSLNYESKKLGLNYNRESLDESDGSLALKGFVPQLKRRDDLSVITDQDQLTNNVLIEGDNMFTLQKLIDLGKKVDVIYIDPPYNTGNDDMGYEDARINKEDSFKHSKWLAFMEPRLKAARQVLSEDGVIFVSIDDNEHAYLKVLMDSIFGEENFVGDLIWYKGFGKNSSDFFSKNTEYILTYASNLNKLRINEHKFTKEKDGFSKIEELVNYAKENNLTSSDLEKNIKKYYKENNHLKGIKAYNKVENDTLRVYRGVTLEDPKGSGYNYDLIHPITNKKCKLPKKGWNRPESSMNELLKRNEIIFGKDEKTLPNRKYYLDEMESEVPKTLIENLDQGGTDFKQLNIDGDFGYPKPKSLIKYLLSIVNMPNATVLDFFGGTGTTGHAVLELNKEDGGNRQFILCTAKENSEAEPDKNIARDITRVRLEKVISGYTTPSGKEVEGIPANLTYFEMDRTELVEKDKITLMMIDEELEYQWAINDIIVDKGLSIIKSEDGATLLRSVSGSQVLLLNELVTEYDQFEEIMQLVSTDRDLVIYSIFCSTKYLDKIKSKQSGSVKVITLDSIESPRYLK